MAWENGQEVSDRELYDHFDAYRGYPILGRKFEVPRFPEPTHVPKYFLPNYSDPVRERYKRIYL